MGMSIGHLSKTDQKITLENCQGEIFYVPHLSEKIFQVKELILEKLEDPKQNQWGFTHKIILNTEFNKFQLGRLKKCVNSKSNKTFLSIQMDNCYRSGGNPGMYKGKLAFLFKNKKEEDICLRLKVLNLNEKDNNIYINLAQSNTKSTFFHTERDPDLLLEVIDRYTKQGLGV